MADRIPRGPEDFDGGAVVGGYRPSSVLPEHWTRARMSLYGPAVLTAGHIVQTAPWLLPVAIVPVVFWAILTSESGTSRPARQSWRTAMPDYGVWYVGGAGIGADTGGCSDLSFGGFGSGDCGGSGGW